MQEIRVCVIASKSSAYQRPDTKIKLEIKGEGGQKIVVEGL